MRYLLDTNHCSYLQRGHPRVVAKFRSLPPGTEVLTSVVTQAELLAGIYLASSARRRRELILIYEELMNEIAEILPITSAVAEHFARITSELARKGRPIPVNDLWIAALAMAHNLILVTSDTHFSVIEGLQVEDWTQAEGEEA